MPCHRGDDSMGKQRGVRVAGTIGDFRATRTGKLIVAQ
jgi:hypothetical protein